MRPSISARCMLRTRLSTRVNPSTSPNRRAMYPRASSLPRDMQCIRDPTFVRRHVLKNQNKKIKLKLATRIAHRFRYLFIRSFVRARSKGMICANAPSVSPKEYTLRTRFHQGIPRCIPRDVSFGLCHPNASPTAARCHPSHPLASTKHLRASPDHHAMHPFGLLANLSKQLEPSRFLSEPFQSR